MSGNYPMMPQAVQRAAATAVSSSLSLNTQMSQIELTNLGPNTVFFRMGTGAQTAVAATDNALPVGHARRYTKPPGANTIAFICAATQTADVAVVEGGGQ